MTAGELTKGQGRTGKLLIKGAGQVYRSFAKNPTQISAVHGVPLEIAKIMQPLVEHGDVEQINRLLHDHPEWIYLWIMLYGGIRSGKTFAVAFRCWLDAQRHPGMKILVVRKRKEQLRNTFLDEFEKVGRLISDDHLDAIGEEVRQNDGSTEYLVWTRNQQHPSKIIFAIEPDQATEDEVKKRWLGYTVAAAVTEETPQLKEISVRTIVSRCSQPVDDEGNPIPWWCATICNPVKPRHWLDKLRVENETIYALGKRPHCLVVRSKPRDNVANLGEGWEEQQRKFFADRPDLIEAWFEGEPELDYSGKPVYGAQFSRKLHVDPSLKYSPLLPLYRGWDFGFHRPACVFVQEQLNGCINVLGELLGEEETIEQFSDKVTKFTRENFDGCVSIRDYGDPACAQQTDKGDTTLVILMRKGIRMNFRPTKIMAGVTHIRTMLGHMRYGRPEIQFSPACPILIEAFERGYKFPDMGDGRFGDQPFKDGYYDHECDAFRYLMVNLHALPLEQESDIPGARFVGGGVSWGAPDSIDMT